MSDDLTTVWEDWSHGTVEPTARIRKRVFWNGSIVTEFCIQLEYNRSVHYKMEEAAYHEVARFDHNIAPNRGHDIREEGIHMDLFPRTDHEQKVWDFPPYPLRQAPQFCREFLEEHRAYYLGRFEPIVGVPVQNSYYR